MAIVEDLSVYLDAFGEDMTLAGAAVVGIFDAHAANHGQAGARGLGLGMLGAGIVADDPMVQLPTADVPAAVFGASLVVGSDSYTVREHLPDGTGMSVLILTRA